VTGPPSFSLQEDTVEDVKTQQQTGTGMVLVDFDRLVAQPGEELSEEEFVERGRTLAELHRMAGEALGRHIDYKLTGTTADETRTEILQHYAAEWGISRSTLTRYWVIATRFTDIERPADVADTTIYEALAGTQTPAEAEEALDAVTGHGMGLQELREVKELRGKHGYQTWEPPRLYLRQDRIYVKVGDREALVAIVVEVGGEDEESADLVRIGQHLLKRRALR
jgi:hypothetical protein